MRSLLLALTMMPVLAGAAQAQDEEALRAGKRQFRACQIGYRGRAARRSNPTPKAQFHRRSRCGSRGIG